ncbi:MAG: sulfatase family protein, partial [Verrucomicrobiales bacterium]
PHTPFHTVPKFEWRFRHLENHADQIYASVLSHADDRIGEVLDTLDRLEVAKNTLVIFSSDNGPARGTPDAKLTLGYDTATGAGWGIGAAKGITGGRRGYKGALFEGGIGVPFIARWPGKVAAGEVDDRSLISAVDLLPTFCEVAGVSLPPDYKPDGVSQVEALRGKPFEKREKPLFWKMGGAWPAPKMRPDHWCAFAVVDENWKLVSNSDGSYVELYDIAKDVYEKQDLKEAEPELAAQLLAKIEQWKSTLPEKPTGDVFSKERAEL